MDNGFITISQYISSRGSLLQKIQAYDLIISKLEESLLISASSGDLKQVELEDGMMKVRSEFRNVSDVIKSMEGLEGLRQMYINRYNGRAINLRGGNF